MSAISASILRKIVKQLQEEEIDVYTLTLYCMNREDLEYFPPQDREKVKRIFDVLMEDTRRHAELLKMIIDLGGS